MKARIFPALAALSALVVSVAPAKAAGTYYYVYVNGVPTDVTASAEENGGHVFLNGNWIGTLNAFGQIIGLNNELIGFQVTDQPRLKLTFSPWKK